MKKIFYFLLLLPLFASAGIPALGNGSAALSLSQEQKMGKQFMLMIRQQLPLVDDPVVNDYINHLGLELASFSPKPHLRFHFFVTNIAEINAFAGPGGYIGINSGLILTAESVSELAAVMAHEIAHVTQRHIARSIEDQSEVRWASLLGVLAAISAGTQSSGAAAAILAATYSTTAQTLLGFSRQYEREADSVGRQTLTAAGYSTAGMTAFMHKLMAQHYPSPYDDLTDSLSSHPSSSSRAADSWDVTKEPEDLSADKRNHLFYLIQARLAAEASTNTAAQVKHFQAMLSAPAMKHNVALRYALTLALFANHQLQAANQHIQQLLKQYPKELLFHLTAARITATQGQLSQAAEQLQQLYQHSPNYFPLVLQYADVLMKTQRNQQAIKLLKAQQKSHPENITRLSLLAKAQYHAGKIVGAYQTHAEILVINGQLQKAAMLLSKAKELANDPITKARVTRQITDIRRQIAQAK